jgi:phosphatidylinositol alpha-mannosyltransferase
MKIGIVTPVFHPYPGGVTEHVYHTYLELRRLGHDVRVITTRFGSGRSPVEEHVVRIGRAVSVPANGSMCPVAWDPFMSDRVRGVLEREGFDVIHVHEPLMPFLSLSAVGAADVPVVGTFHASSDSGFGYRVFGPVLKTSFEKLSRRICVSEAARESVRPYFGGSYELVPNGVDVERFSLADPIPELKDGSFNILFVGRMEPRKGAKHLFRALPEIFSKVPDARLTVVGSGPLSRYYRSFVPRPCLGRVRFEGRVSAHVLARHFATADVYCSPATGGESFGIVLLEAMAAGAAIVASDIAGYRDVVRHGETGILVEPRTPRELASAVVTLREDEGLRAKLVENARKAVRRYSWDRVTAEILEVLRAASGEPGGMSARGESGHAREETPAEVTSLA